MLRRPLVILVSTVMLAAGCGGGGDEASPADDQAAADRAVAEVEELLREQGFAASGDDDDDDDDDLTFDSEECQEFGQAFPGEDEDLPGETASVEGQELERGELTADGGVEETAQATVGFVEEVDDLDPILGLLGDDRLEQCLEEALRNAFEGAAEGATAVEVSELTLERLGSDGLGDAGGGVTVRAQFTVSGFTFPFGFELQMIRVGRALVGVFTSAIGSDQPTTDRRALLATLVDEVRDQAT